jgi:hypothetical protein
MTFCQWSSATTAEGKTPGEGLFASMAIPGPKKSGKVKYIIYNILCNILSNILSNIFFNILFNN